MSMPNRRGKFVADVIDRVFTEQGTNALPCVILRFALAHEFTGGEWADCAEDQFEITNYSYLQKKDGNLNEFAIKALKETFNWDGVDPFWFETAELPQAQLELDWETYEGQERIRVKFMNKLGSSGGGMPERDSDLHKTQKMKSFMRDLRTFSGGTARKPAAPPTSKPNSPPARPSVPPAAPSAPDSESTESTAEKVWEYFADGCEKAGIADIEIKWWALLKNVTGKNDPSAITGEEWGKVKAAAKTMILVDGEDVPF